MRVEIIPIALGFCQCYVLRGDGVIVVDAGAPNKGRRFARALEMGDIEKLVQLLADDVWGLVDDGRGRRRPTSGLRAVSRQWMNALARYGRPDEVRRIRLNGEPALVIGTRGTTLASIHLETREGRVASIRVLLDPPRLARLGLASS